jgi:hypothetical protein
MAIKKALMFHTHVCVCEPHFVFLFPLVKSSFFLGFFSEKQNKQILNYQEKQN